jgi:hypothetical protein
MANDKGTSSYGASGERIDPPDPCATQLRNVRRSLLRFKGC